MKFYIKDGYFLLYRSQGQIHIELILDKFKNKIEYNDECGLDLCIKSKGPIKRNLHLSFNLSKTFLYETNIEKLDPFYKISYKNNKYKIDAKIPTSYIFNKEAAKKHLIRHFDYLSKKPADHVSNNKFINYTNSNVYKPYQGGKVSPR